MDEDEEPEGPVSEWTDEQLMRELARRRPEYAEALQDMLEAENDDETEPVGG